MDLYDRRIVSYVIGDNNNNALVFDTVDEAIQMNPDAHPLFHSDRGFNTLTEHFIINLNLLELRKACQELQSALTTVPWKDFGEF